MEGLLFTESESMNKRIGLVYSMIKNFRRQSMKNALVKWSVGVAILLGGTLFFTGKQVFAHGYVESPVSRGYQGSLDRNTLGWSAAFEK